MTPETAVAVAVIAAVGSIGAAVVAGVAALRSSKAAVANQRIIELEKRLATNRLDIFKPMLDMLAEVLDPDNRDMPQQQRTKRMMSVLKSFATWIQMYGSDQSVRAFHRLMQGTYHDAPPTVVMRLYGQFLLAARGDLGDSETEISTVDLLGIRIKDVYETMADDLHMSDDAYYRKVGWAPPW